MKKQIIAIGGGGFSTWRPYSTEDAALARYFLDQIGKKKPSLCFLPTASADDAGYIVSFYSAFAQLSCIPSHLSLFKPTTNDLESFLLEKDAIFVGGGNTKNMLALWREWSIDAILEKALAKGVVLGGVSAGMNCWYEACVTDSHCGELTALPALGFLSGSACPHYNGEANRRPAYHTLMQQGKIEAGIAIDDYAAVHYINGELFQVISTKQTTAYQVYREEGRIIEKQLLAKQL